MTEVSDRELIQYAYGRLPEERALELEAASKEDAWLDARMLMACMTCNLSADMENPERGHRDRSTSTEHHEPQASALNKRAERCYVAAASASGDRSIRAQRRRRRRWKQVAFCTVIVLLVAAVLTMKISLPERVFALTAGDVAGFALPSNLIEPIAPSYVSAVVFSPDSRQLAYATHSGIIRIASCDHLKTTQTFLFGHGTDVNGLAWHGDLLASISHDERILVWNLKQRTWRVLRQDNADSGAIQDIAFSPDGRLLASIDKNGRVALWETKDSMPLNKSFDVFGSEDGGAYGSRVVWSPDSRKIATTGGGRTNVIKVCSLDGTTVARLTGHREAIMSLAWSPGRGSWLASAGAEGESHIWDVLDGSIQETIFHERGGETQLAWMDANTIALGPSQGAHKYWEINRGVVRVERSRMRRVWSPNRKLYVERPGPSLRLRTASNLFVDELPFNYSIACDLIDTQPHADAYVVATTDGNVRLFDPNSNQWNSFPIVAATVEDVTYHPDGSMIALAHGSGLITIWDATSRRKVAVGEGASACELLTWSNDGARLAAGHRDHVSIWKFSGEKLILDRVFPVPFMATTLDWTPNGRWLLAGLGDLGGISLFDIDRGEEVVIGRRSRKEVEQLNSRVPLREHVRLRVAPDGRYFAANSVYGNWAVFSLDERRLLTARAAKNSDEAEAALLLSNGVVDHNYKFGTPEWVPDSTGFAFGSDSGRVWLANIQELGAPREIAKHASAATVVRWDESGQYLATGDTTGLVQIYDRQGRVLDRLHGHSGAIRQLEWTAGGKLISGDDGGFVYCWDVKRGSALYFDATLVGEVARFSGQGSLIQGDWRKLREQFHFWRRDEQGNYGIVDVARLRVDDRGD